MATMLEWWNLGYTPDSRPGAFGIEGSTPSSSTNASVVELGRHAGLLTGVSSVTITRCAESIRKSYSKRQYLCQYLWLGYFASWG